MGAWTAIVLSAKRLQANRVTEGVLSPLGWGVYQRSEGAGGVQGRQRVRQDTGGTGASLELGGAPDKGGGDLGKGRTGGGDGREGTYIAR